MRALPLALVLAAAVAGAAAAQTGNAPAPTSVDVGPWVQDSSNQINIVISQAGPYLFKMITALAGVSLITVLIRRVLH